jgi:hypothetical protein
VPKTSAANSVKRFAVSAVGSVTIVAVIVCSILRRRSEVKTGLKVLLDIMFNRLLNVMFNRPDALGSRTRLIGGVLPPAGPDAVSRCTGTEVSVCRRPEDSIAARYQLPPLVLVCPPLARPGLSSCAVRSHHAQLWKCPSALDRFRIRVCTPVTGAKAPAAHDGCVRGGWRGSAHRASGLTRGRRGPEEVARQPARTAPRLTLAPAPWGQVWGQVAEPHVRKWLRRFLVGRGGLEPPTDGL